MRRRETRELRAEPVGADHNASTRTWREHLAVEPGNVARGRRGRCIRRGGAASALQTVAQDQLLVFAIKVDDLENPLADLLLELGEVARLVWRGRECLLESIEIRRQLFEQRLPPLQQISAEGALLLGQEPVLVEGELVEIVADPLVTLQYFAHGGI